MVAVRAMNWTNGVRRRSAIHTGPGVDYVGSLPIISLARGSPQCWCPPDVNPGWTDSRANPYPPAIPDPPTGGLPSAREAVAHYLRTRLSLAVGAEEVLVTNGATQGIDVVSSYLCERKGRGRPVSSSAPPV